MLIIQNDSRVPAGLIADHLERSGVSFRTLRLFDGDSLPEAAEMEACIVLGGTMGVHEEGEYPFLRALKRFMREAAEGGVPLLGICLGAQLLAEALGGEVTPGRRGERGVCTVDLTAAGSIDPLFAGLGSPLPVFQWHNDSFHLPHGAVSLAESAVCPGQAFRYRRAWGLQFHPEVTPDIVSLWQHLAPDGALHRQNYLAAQEVLSRCGECLCGNFLHAVANY